MNRLAGKVAIVTGGSRGIGAAIAAAFLDEGAAVVVSGRDGATLDAAVRDLSARGRVEALAADAADAASGERLVAAAREAFGGVHVLVNNAGVIDAPDVWAVTPETWDAVMAVNLRGAFFCARAAAAAMREGGGGSIVNLGSMSAQVGGLATGPAYAAAKAGLEGVNRSLARHFAPLGIRVNCIAPADIDTDMTAAWPAALRARLTAMTPLGRFGRADEVAGAAVFLASDEASYVTGQTLSVNGGAYMG